ncbi:MAG: TonB-dependent receptor plug domain-containing protein [Paenirhodobacter sp.]|uniref:TonB-dependent receptor plug domain-containing protein n=1 Tax=Paenirhodobacter sp. TaxID=1965326 RepID=UPI003D1412DE
MRSTRALRHLLLTAAILSVPVATLAQDTTSLDEIVVWGGLTGIATSDFTRAYSIVTARDIEERGITTVQNALRALPGVSVAATGGTAAAVYIRGGEANHTKVLIDGVEANGTTNGSYSFGGLTVADIESIEVLRGPQSVLYGTSAMAGVIAITTKRAEKEGTSYGGGFEFGGNDSHDANVYLRQRFARGQLSFALDNRRDNDNDGSVKGDIQHNDVDTASLNGDYAISDTVKTGFTLRRIWQDYSYFSTNGAATRPEDYLVNAGDSASRDETYGSLWLEADALGGRLLNRFEISGSNQDTFYRSPAWGNSDYGSTRRTFKYTASIALDGSDARTANQKLNLQLGAERETFDVTDAWSSGKDSRNTRSIALDYQGHFDNGLDLQAGIRHDVIDVFQDPTSWNLSAAWRAPGAAWRLRGSVGKATVYPTMYEQFGYTPGVYSGNPNLKPERSLSYELGADYDLAQGRGTLGLTLFQADVKDMISSAGSTSVNLPGTSTRKGVELSGAWQANDWLNLKASYTYTDAHGPNGSTLTRRPRNELGLQATADTFGGRGSVSADLRYVQGSYDQQWFGSYATKELPEFTTVNLSARYAVTDNVEITGRVVNLFDEKYSEAWGYYGQRRTLYVGVNTRW